MASSAKKSRNWTNKEDKKLLDLLIEQKAQGSAQSEWTVVKDLSKNDGIDRDFFQIRNHYNDMLKKFKACEWLMGGMVVSVDYKLQL